MRRSRAQPGRCLQASIWSDKNDGGQGYHALLVSVSFLSQRKMHILFISIREQANANHGCGKGCGKNGGQKDERDSVLDNLWIVSLSRSATRVTSKVRRTAVRSIRLGGIIISLSDAHGGSLWQPARLDAILVRHRARRESRREIPVHHLASYLVPALIHSLRDSRP